MSNGICFDVVEYFNDGPPETFGTYVGDQLPEVGDVIQLCWLDGMPAYKARVERIDGTVLFVRTPERQGAD